MKIELEIRERVTARLRRNPDTLSVSELAVPRRRSARTQTAKDNVDDDYFNQTLPRVGWIGTGVMGGSMCSHLLHKGYPVVVNTRTKAKADGLVEHGATWADTPKAVSEQSDIVFTIVGFPADVREVYFGADGVLSAARTGQVFVDMTTTEPTLAKEIYEAARAHGADSVDAPVSGGDVGARNATLTIMIGGDQRDGRSADASVRDDGQAGALPGRARRRPAHEDEQSDRDRGHDGRHVRGAALRAQGRPEPRDDGRNHPRRRRRLLGRSTTSRRASSSATSPRVSSSSTSSRTWPSRSPKPTA